MCGRYAIPDPANIPIRFKGTRIGYDLKPRYNAAPSENLPVIVNDTQKHVELMRWGLVPFWAKDVNIGYKMIKVFGFAGLYDVWHDNEGKELKTYTIITTTPNAVVAPIHDRMPAILERKDEEEWLNPDETEPDRLLKLLHPYTAGEMDGYPVSRLVNSPKNDTKEVIEPVTNSG